MRQAEQNVLTLRSISIELLPRVRLAIIVIRNLSHPHHMYADGTRLVPPAANQTTTASSKTWRYFRVPGFGFEVHRAVIKRSVRFDSQVIRHIPPLRVPEVRTHVTYVRTYVQYTLAILAINSVSYTLLMLAALTFFSVVELSPATAAGVDGDTRRGRHKEA